MSARLAILLSGSGSTYQRLAEACAAGEVPATIVGVIASRAGVGGIARATELGHPCAIAAHADEVSAQLAAWDADWIAMAGWLKSWDPPTRWAGRTLNIHPALLPAFGGQGMYGLHVHQAVIAAGCRISGCTVHVVRGAYDSGPILAQAAVPLRSDDDAERLAQRVQAAERLLYPRALAAAIAGGIATRPDGRLYLPALDEER